MTSPGNLRKVVEWGMDAGHSVLDIATGLDLDYLTVGTMYMQIKQERHEPYLGVSASRTRLTDERRAEDERAFKDPAYRNWLRAKRGATATLARKL